VNKNLVYSGLVLMVLSAIALIFAPELHARAVVGVGLLFFIGLGLTVAGSPDPRKE